MTRAVVAGLDARAGKFPIRLTEGDALPFTIEFLEADGATPTPLAAGTYVLEVRRAAGAPVTHTVALTRGGTGNHELTGTFSAVLTAQIGTSRSAVHAIVNTTTSSTLLAGELELVPRGEAGAGWPDNLARVVGLPGPAGDPGAYDAAGTAAAAQAAAIAAAATDATAKADAKVADAINDGVTTVAPSQNAVFDALALTAPLASPALTGVPTAPTAPPGTDSTQIATTAFVLANAPSATAVSTVPATTGLDPASTDVEKALTELAARPSGGGGTFRYRAVQGGYLNPNVTPVTANQGFTGRVAYVPVDVTTEQAWDAIAIHVATAETGATLELGLVADDPLLPGYPGGLIESVTVGLDSTGTAAGLFTSAHTLPPGTYWLASVLSAPGNTVRIALSSNAAGVGTFPYIYSKGVPLGATDTQGAAGFFHAGMSIPVSAPAGMVMNRYLPVPGLRAAAW